MNKNYPYLADLGSLFSLQGFLKLKTRGLLSGSFNEGSWIAFPPLGKVCLEIFADVRSFPCSSKMKIKPFAQTALKNYNPK